MHEQTQRSCCRLAFLALAVLPTLIVVGWVWQITGTSHRDQCLAKLSRELGMIVEATSVEQPWADTLRFRNLLVRDPETAETLARVRQCDLTNDAAGTLITAPELELSPLGWRRVRLGLWQRLPLTAHAQQPVRLGINRLILTGLAQPVELHQIVLREEHHPEARRATLSFCHSSADRVPTRVTIDRRALPADPLLAGTHYQTRGELQTGDSAVRLSDWLFALDARLPATDGLAGKFAGTVRWQETAAGLSAEIRGALNEIDLEQAIGRPLQQRLAGRGELRMSPLLIVEGRLREWQGAFTAQQGEIGVELLRTLEREWGCPLLLRESIADKVAIPFDQLAVRVECSATRVQLRGECPGQTAGTILSTQGHAVMNEPAQWGSSPAAMLAALAPAGTPYLPALPGLAGVWHWLPETPARGELLARPETLTQQR